jgi:hypothetical protein
MYEIASTSQAYYKAKAHLNLAPPAILSAFIQIPIPLPLIVMLN